MIAAAAAYVVMAGGAGQIVNLSCEAAIAGDGAAPAANPARNEPATAAQIDKLVRQLGDKDYYVRQRAQEELSRLGFDAFDALSAAVANEDLEIASRAKYLLRLMRVEWTIEGDSEPVKKHLHDYEFADPQLREAKMRALAGLPDGQGVIALCRLVRFEKSPVLSKMAALTLLGSQAAAAVPNTAMVETVRKALDDSKRPAALWLLTWTRLGSEPDAALAQWVRLIDNELKLLRPQSVETSREIIAGLIRFQAARLKKLGKPEAATAAIVRLVELEKGSPDTLGELLDWLIEQKAWQAVDDLAQRFAKQLADEPGLLYALAEAYTQQGQKDRATEAAGRAFQLHPGKQPKELLHHLVVAYHLRGRGQFAWARREFEHVIVQGGDAENAELRVMAQSVLAEMLHDQGQDLAAAETLQKLVADIDARKVTPAELEGRKPSAVRSRMDYFFACHWETKGDAAKRREALDRALAADPGDIDVLIACYRLSDAPPDYHAKIVRFIKKAAAVNRQLMADDPQDFLPYNQFAWLIGNTEGDFDEALRCSLKSLELKPEEGGFYDTLAHVYFAKGDLDNAVKQQTKAAELEPHSGLIRRQLEFFRKQREEKKK